MGEMIEIKCNACSHAERIFHGSGFFGTNYHYYCSKCLKIEEYSVERPPCIRPPNYKKKELVEEIHKCKSCKIKLKPFIIEFCKSKVYTPGNIFPDTITEITGPAAFRCPACHSKDLTYKDVGLWD